MSVELETEVASLRAQLARSEKQRIAFAEKVRADSHSIATTCMTGQNKRAGIEALTLCQAAADEKNQLQMQQEQAGGYDLGALVVKAGVPSNSETGWEREE